MDLIEIKGKINTAICYARVVEDEAIEQIRRMCDYPMTEGSRIRIMPDVHSGKGCTIGTTMTITDKAVPNVVGVDIGCGMYTVNLGKVDIDFVKVDEAAHFIPSGMNVWEGRQERFDLTELACYRELKDTKRLERSLGTLGGGNHFIEIDEAGDGTKYLVIHSGSRNLGKQVAELYQKLAINLDRGYGDYLAKRDEIIRTYKEQGRRSEIQDALKQLHWQVYESETSMPEDLCYLSGKYLEDYLHDVEICQAFLIKVEGILPSPAEAETEEEMFTMPTIDMVATGRNIMRLREAAGLTVRDLQDIFGFATPQAIYKWQHGTAMPTIDNLVVLAAVLDVPMDEIIVIDVNRTKQISA